MSKSYIPDAYKNRLEFLINLKGEIRKNAAALTLAESKLKGADALLTPLIVAYQAVVEADAALRRATADANNLFANGSVALRSLVNELKSNPNFTDGMGEQMRVFSNNSKPKPADIKPQIAAIANRGGVMIDGSKNYAETLNLYMRRKGEFAWVKIAIKRTRLPFEDQTPLLKPGIPEEREYMARGVMGDDEVGIDSDIVGAVFVG
jgi:hypothetical protein